MHDSSLTRKIVDYVRSHPGTTRSALLQVLPDDTKSRSVSSALNHLAQGGVVQNLGRSGRAARWYPIVISVESMYRKIAKQLLAEMKSIHHSQREDWLASRLQELFGSKAN